MVTGQRSGQPDRAATATPDKCQVLRGFREHADATNDIFHLAAKAIAFVLLEAAQRLEAAQSMKLC